MSETHLTAIEGDVKTKKVLNEMTDKLGVKLPNKTVLVKSPVTSKQARLHEVWTHVQFAHSRMDKQEELLKAIYNKLETLGPKIKAVEDLALGKNPEFEAQLRKETAAPVTISPSQKELYGEESAPDVQDIVKSVLGADVASFMRQNRTLPSALFTLLIPKRLSGVDLDFRSSTVYNASVESDVKKWCERVKQHLFKTYAGASQGIPKFLIH